jgi:hypothetical protein
MKEGNSMLRFLLVEAAQVTVRSIHDRSFGPKRRMGRIEIADLKLITSERWSEWSSPVAA